MELKIFSANASGNVTLFVTTPVERIKYGAFAQRLLNDPELNGEQVAYIVPDSNPSWDGKFEMCGLEFCCNATRSFGLYLALSQRKQNNLAANEFSVKVHASGMREIMTVSGNLKTRWVSVLLPPPLSIARRTILIQRQSIQCTMVEMDGIGHVVLMDLEFDDSLADSIHEIFQKESDPVAMGVLFYNSIDKSMIPVVYVREVETKFLEGSCGSGTAALACALSYEKPDGRYRYDTKQPQGELSSEAIIKDGRVTSVTVDGIIDIEPIKTVVI